MYPSSKKIRVVYVVVIIVAVVESLHRKTNGRHHCTDADG